VTPFPVAIALACLMVPNPQKMFGMNLLMP
jgi:hypothetical protein